MERRLLDEPAAHRCGEAGVDGGEAAEAQPDQPAVAVLGSGPLYSPLNELRFFAARGLPLCFSALLEWGAPPLIAMFFAGATPNSEHLQAALGYGRLFFNCTLLLVLIGAGSYCWSVVPGCIGAGREDRVPMYFWRGITLSLAIIAPLLALQFFSEPLMIALSVPPEVAVSAALYCKMMTVTAALLLIEMHVEIVFVSSGYARSATFNSFITGMCADVALSWLLIYRLDLGVVGCALVSMSVRAARLIVWLLLTCWFRLWPLFVTGGPREGLDASIRAGLPEILRFSDGGRVAGEGLFPACTTDQAGTSMAVEPCASSRSMSVQPEAGEDRLFSWRETHEFLSLALPAIGVNLTGWLIFELQIVAVTNIRGVSQADLAAGAIWIQGEQALSAAQTGWIQAFSMRIIMLLASSDDSGARKSFTLLSLLAAVLVASTTCIPLLVFARVVCHLASNDTDVVASLEHIFWMLAPHAQSRVVSLTATALLIPIGKWKLQLIATFVCFYLISTPLTVILTLTDLAPINVPTKMVICVGTTTVAQVPLALFSLAYMARLDWSAVSKIIASRANTDLTADG